MAKVNKTDQDVEDLVEMLEENLSAVVWVVREDAKSPHELGRIEVAGSGRLIVVCYRSGTALVQGKGDSSTVAQLCRASDWKCNA